MPARLPYEAPRLQGFDALEASTGFATHTSEIIFVTVGGAIVAYDS